MKNVRILDCTLRDGGYINEWKFGKQTIGNILDKLKFAGVDIIECGYLNCKGDWDDAYTLFSDINSLDKLIPEDKGQIKYAAMIDYGKFPVEHLPNAQDSRVDYLRVCFAKGDRWAALEYSRDLMAKGYCVFLQPMNTISYSQTELESMLSQAAVLNFAAVYFVDSFGVMRRSDVERLYETYNRILPAGIDVGYHTHNNFQLAYSNALALLELQKERPLVIDSSVFGMGRGAGNLNTELFVDYLNQTLNADYRVQSLLDIMDEELNKIYDKKRWGYSLPHYLSAANNCHPSYATYLAEKNTLTTKSIGIILAQVDEPNKNRYSKELIERLYHEYQANDVDDAQARKILCEAICGKNILLLAPGNSLNLFREDILAYIEKMSPVIIGVNAYLADYPLDMVFVSNQKRLLHILETVRGSNADFIITSNLKNDVGTTPIDYIINYTSLRNESNVVGDNAGLMLLKLLQQLGVCCVALAGFDGYTANAGDYISAQLDFVSNPEVRGEKNEAMRLYLSTYENNIPLVWVTPSLYSQESN